MPTLREALGTYLEVDRAPLTNKQYRIILGALARGIGPDNPITFVSFEMLLHWLDTQQIGRTTRRNYISIIKAFFNWTCEVGYLASSPARHIKRGRQHEDDRQPRAIPADELRRIVEYAKLTSPRNYALLLFMADTGCRVGGATSLTLDNLHVDDGYAWLLEKGGQWVRALFGPDTAAALAAWLKKRPRAAAHPYVWTGLAPEFKALSTGGIRYVLQSLSTKTGCTREWTPHAIRHAVAYAWADAGVSPAVIAGKLWHSDESITLKHYYDHSDERIVMTQQRLPLAALKTPDHQRFAPVPLPVVDPPAKQDDAV